MTKDQAIELAGSGWWKGKNARQICMFQMFEDKLCMPFSDFHKAVEDALGRPVFTHEFGLNRDGLQKELLGDKQPPTMEEILAMLPANKTIVIKSPSELERLVGERVERRGK